MKKILFIFFCAFISLSAQSKDPQQILEKVKQNFNRVKDYSVNAKIKIDIEFLKVPEMNAKVYFKQPDKVKLDSKGFAMLPKQAFNFSPTALLSNKYSAVFNGSEKLEGEKVNVVRVIPDNDSSDIVLSTLWVQENTNVIRKIESTSRQGGTFSLNLAYNSNSGYPLPSSIKFVFDLPKTNFPKKLSGKINNDKEEKKSSHPGQGIVKIEYSGYKVNQGLSDNLFVEKQKK